MEREPVTTPIQLTDPPRQLDVTHLLEREREIKVVFQGQVYRLTLTRNQKLILTK